MIKKKAKVEEKIDKFLDMPEEICSKNPKLIIMDFKKMVIENYKAILEYQDIYIRIKTYNGILNVSGINLKLEDMNQDDILITGNIENVDFERNE